MLTIEELNQLTHRYGKVVQMRSGGTVTLLPKRVEHWSELYEAQEQGLRKIPSLLIKLSKFQSQMDTDERKLLTRLIKNHQDNESEDNLSWVRISLHMDTLSQLDRAATRKGVSKSELAEIAIREYCKAIGIE